MLREAGKKLRTETPKNLTAHEYAIAIEVALKQEIGASRHAVKTLCKLTNASERTVQNWLAGVRGPSAVHLILLAQNFSSVRSTIMFLSGQEGRYSVGSEIVVDLLFEAIALLTQQ